MPITDTALLTCSYVVLNKPNVAASDSLQFPPQFVATLFDLPQSTGVASTPAGLVISAPGKYGPRMFGFNPLKIEIQNDDPMSLQQTAGRVFHHLKKHGFPLDPSSHGLNYELEFRITGADDSTKWLADKFAAPGFPGIKRVPTAKVLLDSLDVRLEGFEQIEILRLQPRAGKRDRFFAYLNLDFKEGRLLQGEQLEGEVTSWLERAKEMLVRLLGV